MTPRVDSPSPSDVIASALKVLVAQGIPSQAARTTLQSMARERGLPVTRCATLVVASVNGRVN
ncbi:hypothetical protein [Amycolatopsis alba]|uniref:ANTAR domain-containing protein n=1 Tax=Amycolatopsis alba DSM 44262 TaxID=1125972 RepID=A0A229S8R6_AMYAL|nr:hypothetical protein [Amycolatopsis alba]OXM54974.1 hypothetical protein CFP75_02220 [Amycolatopsis alba DSM 44262]